MLSPAVTGVTGGLLGVGASLTQRPEVQVIRLAIAELEKAA
jgi:hypothetical protein